MQEDSDPAYTYRNAQGAIRVIRGRGCNESFRAAVDHSYEVPLSDMYSRIEMETRKFVVIRKCNEQWRQLHFSIYSASLTV